MLLALCLVGAYSLAVEFALLRFVLPMLSEAGALRPNFRGIMIPVSAGITFPFSLLIAVIPYQWLGLDTEMVWPFLLGVVTMSMIGLADDLLGARDTLGFKGHISSLFKGRLTTGGMKAVMGGVIALLAALTLYQTWYIWLADAAIIALFTNSVNLLDLRPGRAIKGFLFFLVLVLLLSTTRQWPLVVPLVAVVLAYFPFDLKARAMMGDAGSNVLGFALGFLAVAGFGLAAKLAALAVLIGLNLLTEKYSLTVIIEHNRFLRMIDSLGREMRADD